MSMIKHLGKKKEAQYLVICVTIRPGIGSWNAPLIAHMKEFLDRQIQDTLNELVLELLTEGESVSPETIIRQNKRVEPSVLSVRLKRICELELDSFVGNRYDDLRGVITRDGVKLDEVFCVFYPYNESQDVPFAGRTAVYNLQEVLEGLLIGW